MDYRLILVNKEHKIEKDFIEKVTLIKVKDVNDEDILVEKETYEAYLDLKDFLNNMNIIIGISSGYRSLDHQQRVYNDFVERYGIDYA